MRRAGHLVAKTHRTSVKTLDRRCVWRRLSSFALVISAEHTCVLARPDNRPSRGLAVSGKTGKLTCRGRAVCLGHRILEACTCRAGFPDPPARAQGRQL